MIVDLTYEKLIYDPVAHNLPRILTEKLRDRHVICSAASKAYAMTGWRCGWAIGPAAFIAQCNALQGHATSNVNSITQKAAIAALTGPQDGVTMMLEEYRRRRDAVWGWLTADPRITCVKPRGAFYLFPYIADVLEATGFKARTILPRPCWPRPMSRSRRVKGSMPRLLPPLLRHVPGPAA